MPADRFGPRGIPPDQFYHFPRDRVHYELVQTEDQIANLKSLVGLPLVGVDTEWRPQFNQLER